MPFFLLHRNWLSKARSLCSTKDEKEFQLDTLEEEIHTLEQELPQPNQEIGFCHNDLQYGNIMMDEEMRAITIIVSIHAVVFTYVRDLVLFRQFQMLIILISY